MTILFGLHFGSYILVAVDGRPLLEWPELRSTHRYPPVFKTRVGVAAGCGVHEPLAADLDVRSSATDTRDMGEALCRWRNDYREWARANGRGEAFEYLLSRTALLASWLEEPDGVMGLMLGAFQPEFDRDEEPSDGRLQMINPGEGIVMAPDEQSPRWTRAATRLVNGCLRPVEDFGSFEEHLAYHRSMTVKQVLGSESIGALHGFDMYAGIHTLGERIDFMEYSEPGTWPPILSSRIAKLGDSGYFVPSYF